MPEPASQMKTVSSKRTSTQGVLPRERAEIQKRNIAKMNASQRGLELQVDAMLERLNRPGYREAEPEGYARQREMAVCGTVEGYARCCAAIAAMSYDDKLDRIATPTLVVAGSLDKSTSPERISPLSTKMHFSRSPMASRISAAVTLLSTPPESPQTT